MPDFEGKPIRYRGYYRAVKRGDHWAVSIANTKDVFQRALKLMYRNVDWPFMFKENPFLKLLPNNNEDWGGAYTSYTPVPMPIPEAKRKRSSYRWKQDQKS